MTQPAPVPPPPPTPPSGTPYAATTPPGHATASGSATPPPQSPAAGSPVAAAAPAHSKLNAPNFAWPLAGVGLFIAGIFATLWGTGQKFPLDSVFGNPEATAAKQAAQEAAEANRQLEQSARENSALASASENRLSRQKWEDLKRRLDRATNSIAELQSLTAKWNSSLAALRTSEQGKRLAGNATLLEQFAPLAAKPRVTVDELESWSQQLRDIDEVVTQGLDTRSLKIEPKAAFGERVQEILTSADTALRSQKSDDAGLGLLLDSLSESDRPGEKTLAQALGELDQAQIRSYLIVQAAELKKVRDAAEAADRQNLLETEQKKLDSENARKRSEREVDVQRAKNDADVASEEVKDFLRAVDAARKKREHVRRFEADLPEMRRLLAPLITPGKTELTKDGWRPIQEARPVSLSALTARGILKPAPPHHTLTNMLQVFGPPQNDRDFGSFPTRLLSLEDDSGVRVQKFLTEYGDVLVERKLLLP
ncbi:MAG: hypothetical protein NT069_18280 [Planctomycetota bacterium]|nr:hypothetical protein [Planctomycetota bacterium]